MTSTSLAAAQAKSFEKPSSFWKRGKFATKSCKMVYYTLCSDSVNRQRSRWKVRIYTAKKLTFLKFT